MQRYRGKLGRLTLQLLAQRLLVIYIYVGIANDVNELSRLQMRDVSQENGQQPMLNGTPRPMSAERWYIWHERRPFAT